MALTDQPYTLTLALPISLTRLLSSDSVLLRDTGELSESLTEAITNPWSQFLSGFSAHSTILLALCP